MYLSKKLTGLMLAGSLALAALPLPALAASDITLAVGSTGESVTRIQKKLIDMNYMQASATGFYGQNTKSAIIAFQKDNGLTADGKANPATQRALLGEAVEASGGLAIEETKSLAIKGSDEIQLSRAPIIKQTPVYTDPGLMKAGSQGESVTKLQTRLKDLGYFTDGAITGYYGSTTTSAVRNFQTNNGLTADGVAGANTLAKLYSDTAVKASASNAATASTKGKQTVELAKVHLGKPYLWGGNGPASFDCSGFVAYVLKQQGQTNFPRNSYQQSLYTKWKEVSYSNLTPGDLMFFDTRTDGSVPIGHVGIYIGDGQMIHASSSAGKIVISQVTSGYYKERFRIARRVFN